MFFTWWQSVIISLSAEAGMIHARPGPDNWTGDEIVKGLQDYIICIEMFFFSLAFSYSFSYHDYTHIHIKYKVCNKNIKLMLAITTTHLNLCRMMRRIRASQYIILNHKSRFFMLFYRVHSPMT